MWSISCEVSAVCAGDRRVPRVSVGIFDGLCRRRSISFVGRAAEFERGQPVGFLEGAGEVAVAREAEIEGDARQVGIVPEKVERARKTQLKLVAIERQAFDLLEHLGQVDCGDADGGRDLRESPAAAEVGCQYELGAVDSLLATGRTDRRMRTPSPPCALEQGKDQRLRLERLQ